MHEHAPADGDNEGQPRRTGHRAARAERQETSSGQMSHEELGDTSRWLQPSWLRGPLSNAWGCASLRDTRRAHPSTDTRGRCPHPGVRVRGDQRHVAGHALLLGTLPRTREGRRACVHRRRRLERALLGLPAGERRPPHARQTDNASRRAETAAPRSPRLRLVLAPDCRSVTGEALPKGSPQTEGRARMGCFRLLPTDHLVASR